MGFYLPGIGEAIGGGLRMMRQNELMQQSQKVLQDESKPWAERVALVTAAHPELATNPQLQAMLEAGRQADADKMARTKFDQEQAAAASAQRFKDLLGKTPVEQQRELIMNNPDMAVKVVPELLKTYQAEEEAIKEEDRWLRRNELTSAQKDRRAQVVAGAAAGKEQRAEQRWVQGQIASGQMDPATGAPILPAQRQAAANEAALETDLAKKRQTVQVAEETQRSALPSFISELESYKKLGSESGGETFGKTAATINAKRTALATALAKQMAGPGMATNKQDVEDAKQLIPEPGYFTSSESFEAALDEIIRQQRTKLIGTQGVTVD